MSKPVVTEREIIALIVAAIPVTYKVVKTYIFGK
jgi:hypothetical protein